MTISKDSIINVFLVEDDIEWIQIIRDTIKEDTQINLVGVAKSKDEFYNQKDLVLKSDIVLMDINLDGRKREGIKLAKTINDFCNAKVIMLTCMDDEDVVISSVQSGIRDYIIKNHLKTLVERIYAVYNEKSVNQIIFSEFNKIKYELKKAKLFTPSEKKIYELRELGLTITQIANTLCKSERTIKNQFNTMYKKFEVNSYDELFEKIKKY